MIKVKVAEALYKSAGVVKQFLVPINTHMKIVCLNDGVSSFFC